MASTVFMLLTGAMMSGAIALLGNVLGRKVGRRKLSIFGLRPRHTATIITILSGMLSFILALGVATLASKRIQDSLFQFDRMQSQMEQLRADTAELQRLVQIADDRALKVRIVARTNLPLFVAGHPVYMGVVDGSRPELVQAELDSLAAEANTQLLALFNQAREAEKMGPLPAGHALLKFEPETALRDLKIDGRPTLVVLRAYWSTYVQLDEEVRATVEIRPYELVYPKGAVIAARQFEPGMAREDIVRRMEQFLRGDLQGVFQKTAIMPSPGKDRVVLEVPLGMVVDVQERILRTRKPLELIVVASRDTYTTGPVDAVLQLRPVP